MHRIDGAGATADNKFTEGDAATGVAATVVTGDWLNSVQEEVVGVILEAGITLDKASTSQLREAVEAISAKAGGLAGTASALKITTTGTNATISVTADAICLKSDDGLQKVVGPVNVEINSAAVGVNGLDAGLIASSKFYSVWVIWNGTLVSGLISLSATAPTLPSGYTHKARIGWVMTDATANKLPLSMVQFGSSAQLKVAGGSNVPSLPVVASGSQGTVGSTGVLVIKSAAGIPPTASQVKLAGFVAGTSTLQVSPNTNMSIGAGTPAVTISTSTTTINNVFELTLEGDGIYYAGNATSVNCSLHLYGWEDNI